MREPITAEDLQDLLFMGGCLFVGPELLVVVVVVVEEGRPLMVEMCERPEQADWTAALGMGGEEQLEGSMVAGLLGLSLPESVSTSGRLSALPLLSSSSRGPLSFIFLQLGRTLYFRGRGPFWKMNAVFHYYINSYL